ncbi:MAG TPA: pitrilysin family protein [Actinomycetota bacterium]|nr:pitrilysin family protein [Actinomycetota bacterium]
MEAFEQSRPRPGVRLVTERMPHVLSASVGLWVDLGARDEPPGLAGASHLLEHLLFKGTPTRSARQVADCFDAVGGEINAFSAREYTCYYARVLSADVPMAVETMLDMFSSALLRAEDVESERRVVVEEIHMTHDTPDDLVHDMFLEQLWPGHALGRPIIGTLQSIESMRRDDLSAFYRDGYVPARLVVAAAGDVEHEALGKLVASSLEGPAGTAGRSEQPAPGATGPVAAYESRDTEQVHLVWGCPTQSRSHPDRYALSVLNTLYGGGMSSRLFQSIREERGLAYAVYSGYQLYLETGVFSVYAGTQRESAQEVLAIARGEAAALASGGATSDEVERAKGHVRGSIALSMDDPGGRMSRIGKAELVHGRVETVDDVLDRVEAVSVDDVSRVAAELFGGPGFALASVGPVDQGALDDKVEPLTR